MNQQLFTTDYGTLPHSFFSSRQLTNPYELLQSDELTSLLYLCGVGESDNGVQASDYQKFKALCCSFPVLKGHTLKEQITQFLKKHFPSLPEPSPETCDLLWREISNELLKAPKTGIDFLPQWEFSWLSDRLDLPKALPKNVSPILNCNLFLSSRAVSYSQWREEICSVFSAFRQAGCQSVLLCIESSFSFAQPSPYHVENALRTQKKTREQNDLLLSQILREISALCCEQKVTLRLLLECKATETISLLRYIEHSVGLPNLYWSAAHREGSETMLAFASLPHPNEMRWALHCRYLQSSTELSVALQFAVARYPIGRLSLVSGADLRYIDVMQGRSSEILEKSL